MGRPLLDAGIRELICEGACNPDLPFLDEAVQRYRKGEASDNGTRPTLNDPSLLRRLRALRHTEHVQINAASWSCCQCSTVRPF